MRVELLYLIKKYLQNSRQKYSTLYFHFIVQTIFYGFTDKNYLGEIFHKVKAQFKPEKKVIYLWIQSHGPQK